MTTTTYQTYDVTPIIGWGHTSLVFAISENTAVKVIRDDSLYKNCNPERFFEKGLETQKLFYESEIAVPRPYGILEVTLKHETSQEDIMSGTRVGLVMQRLHGFKGSSATGDLRKKLEDLLRVEKERALALEYIPCNGLINTVYVSDEDRLYFIDLCDWINFSTWSNERRRDHRLPEKEKKDNIL